MSDARARVGDVFEAGLFPLSPETHDQGLRWLFDLSTLLMLLDCRPGDRVLPPGDYVVKVDLVDEFICWFSDSPSNQPSEHRVVVTP